MFFNSGLPVLYASVVFLALNGLFAKTIPLDAVSITHLRSVVAALSLVILLFLQKHSLKVIRGRRLFQVYLLGVVMGLHWITFFKSMQISSVAVGMISLFSYPVITVLIEPLFQHSKPRFLDLFAGLVVLLGVLVMMVDDLNSDSNVVVGVFWGVASAVLFSVRNTTQKYMFADIPSVPLMMHQVIAVALMLIVFADWPTISEMKSLGWVLLVVQGIICTAGAHTLLTISLKLLPAKTVALISCLQPLFAAIIAWLVLNEVPGLFVFLGGIVILGVAVFESLRKFK